MRFYIGGRLVVAVRKKMSPVGGGINKLAGRAPGRSLVGETKVTGLQLVHAVKAAELCNTKPLPGIPAVHVTVTLEFRR